MLKRRSSTLKKKARRLDVQESYESLSMDIQVIVMTQRPSTKNPIARILKYFTPKRFKDKTKYNRKRDGEIWKRNIWKGL